MPDRLVSRFSPKARWTFATGFVLATSLTMIFVVGVVLDQRGEIQSLREARASDVRAKAAAEKAETSAANTQAVVSCLDGVYRIPDFLAALDGLATVLDNQILGAMASLDADPGGPLAPNRRATLRRATAAKAGLDRLISGEDGRGGIVRQRKTVEQCRALAEDLNVDFEKLAKQARTR